MIILKKYKAVKKEVYRDKYFTTIVYEYRDHEYEVTYANGWQVCSTPAHIQHRSEQEKIDKLIDNPIPESKYTHEEFLKDLDDFFNSL